VIFNLKNDSSTSCFFYSYYCYYHYYYIDKYIKYILFFKGGSTLANKASRFDQKLPDETPGILDSNN